MLYSILEMETPSEYKYKAPQGIGTAQIYEALPQCKFAKLTTQDKSMKNLGEYHYSSP